MIVKFTTWIPTHVMLSCALRVSERGVKDLDWKYFMQHPYANQHFQSNQILTIRENIFQKSISSETKQMNII